MFTSFWISFISFQVSFSLLFLLRLLLFLRCEKPKHNYANRKSRNRNPRIMHDSNGISFYSSLEENWIKKKKNCKKKQFLQFESRSSELVTRTVYTMRISNEMRLSAHHKFQLRKQKKKTEKRIKLKINIFIARWDMIRWFALFFSSFWSSF